MSTLIFLKNLYYPLKEIDETRDPKNFLAEINVIPYVDIMFPSANFYGKRLS